MKYSLVVTCLLFITFVVCCVAQDTGRNVEVIQTAQAGQYLQSTFNSSFSSVVSVISSFVIFLNIFQSNTYISLNSLFPFFFFVLLDMGTIRLDYGITPVPTCQDSISIDANTRYQKVSDRGRRGEKDRQTWEGQLKGNLWLDRSLALAHHSQRHQHTLFQNNQVMVSSKFLMHIGIYTYILCVSFFHVLAGF